MAKLKALLLTAAVAPLSLLGVLSGCATHHEGQQQVSRAEKVSAAQRRARAARTLVKSKRVKTRRSAVREPATAGPDEPSRAIPLQRREPVQQRMTAPPPAAAPPPLPKAAPASPVPAPPAPPPAPPAVQPVAPVPIPQGLTPAPQLPPSEPPPPPDDPLPTQPTPAPDRPDALPAPPNRVNFTPRQSGGGPVVMQQAAAPEAARAQQPPAVGAAALGAGRQLGPLPSAGALKIDQARQLFAGGRVLEARAALEAALPSSPADALHELGRTFDPYYLSLLPRIDGSSEPRRAAHLYREAIANGSMSAGGDLDRLRSTLTGPR